MNEHRVGCNKSKKRVKREREKEKERERERKTEKDSNLPTEMVWINGESENQTEFQ